jgi:hypothetical protein
VEEAQGFLGLGNGRGESSDGFLKHDGLGMKGGNRRWEQVDIENG